MKRRSFFQIATGGLLAASSFPVNAMANAGSYEISKSDAEWKKILTPEQYHILREEGTEKPFTSALVNEHREGTYMCAGCDYPLFESSAKFDSGTGWPSFFFAIQRHVATKRDRSLFMERTEYHCARCGGHHGHLFDDGPKPTGLRYCSNGAALTFRPKVA